MFNLGLSLGPMRGTSLMAKLGPPAVQIFTNTDWSGGTTPTSWSAAGATGTRTAAVSTIDAADNSIRFQATAQRPFLQQSFAAAIGEVWTISADVEAVGDVSTLIWSNLLNISGVTASAANFNDVTTNGATVIGSLGTGRIFARFTMSSAGTCAFRVGIGCGSNATGDITLSRPALYKSTYTGYIRVA